MTPSVLAALLVLSKYLCFHYLFYSIWWDWVEFKTELTRKGLHSVGAPAIWNDQSGLRRRENCTVLTLSPCLQDRHCSLATFPTENDIKYLRNGIYKLKETISNFPLVNLICICNYKCFFSWIVYASSSDKRCPTSMAFYISPTSTQICRGFKVHDLMTCESKVKVVVFLS